MSNQFNSMPTYQVPLEKGGHTIRDWYFFWLGLFRGLPPGNVEPYTPAGSPDVYSAAKRGFMIVEGGTVTAIEFSRDGTTFYDMGVVAGSIPVSAADQLRVTYAVAPTMTFVPT